MIQFIQFGNTVRVTALFLDWDDNPVDPELIKFIVYNTNYEKLEEISIGAANKLETGKYYVDYIPQDVGVYIYEWYARIGGTPSIKRNKLPPVRNM